MRAWRISLAVTVLAVIGASAYDLNGRIANEVQKIAAMHLEAPAAQREFFSRQLQRWAPDDSVAILFAFAPVGWVLAGGLALSFVVLAFAQDAQSLPVLVFSVIGVIGCVAVVGGNQVRVEEYHQAEAAFAEWGGANPGTTTWVMHKDSFLANLVRMKLATLLMNAGLIATAVALGYAVAHGVRGTSLSGGARARG